MADAAVPNGLELAAPKAPNGDEEGFEGVPAGVDDDDEAAGVPKENTDLAGAAVELCPSDGLELENADEEFELAAGSELAGLDPNILPPPKTLLLPEEVLPNADEEPNALPPPDGAVIPPPNADEFPEPDPLTPNSDLGAALALFDGVDPPLPLLV